MNSVRLTNLNLKNQRGTKPCCKDINIRKLDFMLTAFNHKKKSYYSQSCGDRSELLLNFVKLNIHGRKFRF